MNEKETIEKFYTAFQQRDWQAMQSCYDDSVHFSDPVFTDLKGSQAKAMWHMLVTSAKDLEISFSNITVSGNKATCDWEARYSFSRTGRAVHNRIHAEFQFADGKIVRHADTFDLAKWAGMALGLPGILLGWTSWMQNKIRGTANSGLSRFLVANPQYGKS